MTEGLAPKPPYRSGLEGSATLRRNFAADSLQMAERAVVDATDPSNQSERFEGKRLGFAQTLLQDGKNELATWVARIVPGSLQRGTSAA